MTNTQLATASLDDIVFDGRNRHYGAYQLRALYQRHMTRALIIATALCALLLVFPLVARWLEGPPAPPRKVTVLADPMAPPLDPKTATPPPVTPPPVAPPAQLRPATIRFTPPVVAPDPQVTEDVPEQAALQNANISTVTRAGSDEPADLTQLQETTGPTEVAGTVAEKPYAWVEQMPELPGGGGNAAIVAAIQKAVKYPALALRNQVEGRVFVSFTVNAQGEISDVNVVKGLGSGLDEETIRAVKTLPKFIPGKQNGRAVSVSFTVPVTFKIQ
ncbi:energy transducer TonB [Hymenobacter sp. BT439]|uniref:Energy transducer TonB n=2 Tax=Hymenobacter properus TaxID=2791026 RepID=A0A931BHC1_9BACT|nr:energy transducer TonB [Hymenobacter properus]